MINQYTIENEASRRQQTFLQESAVARLQKQIRNDSTSNTPANEEKLVGLFAAWFNRLFPQRSGSALPESR